jgi:Ca2+/Na+ antiporter
LQLLEFIASFIGIIILGYLLAEGSDFIGKLIGRRFTGRILLSISSELPEFLVVAYSVILNIPDVGLGAILGSNILMMSLGISIFILASTTRFSLKPLKSINLSKFKNDIIIFLVLSILIPVTYLDGFEIYDAIVFLSMYIIYIYLAGKERKLEVLETSVDSNGKRTSSSKLYASILFIIIGTVGLVILSETFTSSLNNIAINLGIPAIVLALILSPLAAEMPEKASLVFLARKGGESVDIMIGTIFGSKILNSSFLITMFVVLHYFLLGGKVSFSYTGMMEAILALVVGIIATVFMLDRKITKIEGFTFLATYIFTIAIQFLFF